MHSTLIGKHKLAAALVAASVLAAGVSFAKGHGHRMFAFLDRNNDGKIEKREARDALLEVHAKVDKDNDGAVTRKEAKAFHDERRKEWKEKRKEKDRSKNEGRRGPPEKKHDERRGHGKRGHKGHHHGRFFAKLDQNRDGKITRNEVTAMADEKFSKMDRNGDGAVTKKEARAARKEWHKKHRKHRGNSKKHDGA